MRPQLRRLTAGGRVADGGVGFLSGILGGTTGFGGIFLGTALLLGGTGTVTPDTVRLFLIGLPALLLGSWVGLRLYGRLDEAGFRKVVLLLLLVSGIALIAPILFVT